MNIEEVKEAVVNFNYYIEEIKRLSGSLESGGTDLMDMMISSSKKESQQRRRIEKMERHTSALLMGMEKAELTDKEWTVVDLSIEGMSHRAIGGVLGCSDSHTGRHFRSACQKIADFLSGKA